MKLPKTCITNRSLEKGATLIEMLILIGLIGVIGSFGLTMSYSSLSRSKLETEADTLISLALMPARMRALANIRDTHHGVHITDNSFIFFEGSVFDPQAPHNHTIPREESIHIESNEDILFEKLSGNVILGEGIVLLETETASRTISITRWGGIDW